MSPAPEPPPAAEFVARDPALVALRDRAIADADSTPKVLYCNELERRALAAGDAAGPLHDERVAFSRWMLDACGGDLTSHLHHALALDASASFLTSRALDQAAWDRLMEALEASSALSALEPSSLHLGAERGLLGRAAEFAQAIGDEEAVAGLLNAAVGVGERWLDVATLPYEAARSLVGAAEPLGELAASRGANALAERAWRAAFRGYEALVAGDERDESTYLRAARAGVSWASLARGEALREACVKVAKLARRALDAGCEDPLFSELEARLGGGGAPG
ncbi:MAG: hypothetical protein R3A48_16955 [Polyangiales bacterium]